MKQNKNQSVYAIIYGRVNKGQQNEFTNKGEEQIQSCIKFAKNKGFNIGAQYLDIGSCLRSQDDSSTLYKIKKQLQLQPKHKFVLVAMDISRISRNRKISTEYINELASIGVDVEFVNNCNVSENALSLLSYSRVSSNEKSNHRSILEQKKAWHKIFKQKQ